MERKTQLANDNDNDKFPFVSIGLAALLILNKLRLAAQLLEMPEEQDKRGKGDTNAGRGYQEKGAKYGGHIP